jgi:ATP-binding cassette subfamily B (MDR/TAP) protein 1
VCLLQIALVAQEPVLYAGSIRDNILYGYDGTEVEMLNAADKANAHGFISTADSGYDTNVGEKGVQLSGKTFFAPF